MSLLVHFLVGLFVIGINDAQPANSNAQSQVQQSGGGDNLNAQTGVQQSRRTLIEDCPPGNNTPACQQRNQQFDELAPGTSKEDKICPPWFNRNMCNYVRDNCNSQPEVCGLRFKPKCPEGFKPEQCALFHFDGKKRINCPPWLDHPNCHRNMSQAPPCPDWLIARSPETCKEYQYRAVYGTTQCPDWLNDPHCSNQSKR